MQTSAISLQPENEGLTGFMLSSLMNGLARHKYQSSACINSQTYKQQQRCWRLWLQGQTYKQQRFWRL